MNFTTYKVEIAPAFRTGNSPIYIFDPAFTVWLCDTNNSGRYKLAAPAAEREKVIKCNAIWKGDLFALVRMAKTWKRYCSVPIKSFYLEQLGMEFLAQWPHTGKGAFWYDWMMRDFFGFMLSRQNGSNLLPVSNEVFFYHNAWASKAESAFKAASQACRYEQLNYNDAAGEEWQKIFGYNIPKEA
jgi:hypothetical protein